MALPASGAISLQAIQTEFGGTNPISISEYYRGGANVPSNSSTLDIPTSGTISLNQFHGAADTVAPTINPTPNPTNTSDSGSTISATVSATTALTPSGGNGTYTYTVTFVSQTGSGSNPQAILSGNNLTISLDFNGVGFGSTVSGTVTYSVVAHSAGLNSTTHNVVANLDYTREGL